MSGSKFIPINITKARVAAIYLFFKEDGLKYRAEVALISTMSGEEKQITTVQIGNDSWSELDRAECTIVASEVAKALRDEIEIAVIRHMNSKQNILEHKP